jgi:hypothetical protein
MPSAAEVLARLAAAANDLVPIAIFWHVIIAAVILAIGTGIAKPTARAVMLGGAALLSSVAIVAGTTGNPFNAIVFVVLAVVVTAFAVRARGPARLGSPVAVSVGAVALTFGGVYPHFVEVRAPLELLYTAPLGVVPCPTLAVVIGAALIGDGLGSRGASVVLATAGLVYAVVGVAWLRVTLDVGLGFAGLALLLSAAVAKRSVDVGRGATPPASPRGGLESHRPMALP